MRSTGRCQKNDLLACCCGAECGSDVLGKENPEGIRVPNNACVVGKKEQCRSAGAYTPCVDGRKGGCCDVMTEKEFKALKNFIDRTCLYGERNFCDGSVNRSISNRGRTKEPCPHFKDGGCALQRKEE